MEAGAGVPVSGSTRAAQVFMSYARADDVASGEALSRFVDFIRDRANERGGVPIEVFRDTEGTNSGEYWKEKILFEVRRADVFLMFSSEEFWKSEWCRPELDAFLKGQEERQVDPPRILWVPLAPAYDEVTKYGLRSIQLWLADGQIESLRSGDFASATVGKSFEDAVGGLRRLVDQAAPPRPRNASIARARPELEQFHFIGAFDSVRTQRMAGHTRQGLVQLRAKLAYLLGYTTVLAEAQAYDSLGAIECVAQAWDAYCAVETPLVVPFRIAYFASAKPHVMDVALARLTHPDFESSAWRMHGRYRDSRDKGSFDLKAARCFPEWERMAKAANFLSWFPSERPAMPSSIALYERLLGVCETAERQPQLRDSRLVLELRGLLDQSMVPDAPGTRVEQPSRSKLYSLIDQRLFDEDVLIEPLKDLVDIAYNYTVGTTVLGGATTERRRRSMVLTDPTPESRDPDLQTLLAIMIGRPPEGRGAETDLIQSAWERFDLSRPYTPRLPWEGIFEVARHPDWSSRRNALIEARRSPKDRNERVAEARWNLLSWLKVELPENLDIGSARNGMKAELMEHDERAGVGDIEAARDVETGVARDDIRLNVTEQ